MHTANNKTVFHTADKVYGASCAAFHFSGAIKSIPGITNLPFDASSIFFGMSVTIYIFQASSSKVFLSLFGGVHLFLQSLLNLFLLFSAVKSNSSQILYEKLFHVTVIGFAMTILSLSVSSSEKAFKSFTSTCFFVGMLCSFIIPATLVFDFSVRGGPVETEFSRVQYQLVGILFASASVIAATSLIESWPLHRLQKLFSLSLLVVGSAILGGRASFFSLICSTLIAASLMYVKSTKQRPRSPLITLVLFLIGSYLFSFVLFLLGATELIVYLRLLKHLNLDQDIRVMLWGMAVSKASVFGLGTASFAPTMGLGDLRRWYPHNLMLEALVELGVPGFMVFCMLLVTAISSLCICRHSISDNELSILAGFACICGAQIFTSTDLGNRMAWFWLGLLTGASCRATCLKKS